MKRFVRNIVLKPLPGLSLLVILLVALAAIFAPLLATHDPAALDVINALKGPSKEHWLGTDDLGRDLFSRMLFGSRVSLIIAMGSAVGSGVFGMIIGLVAGYIRRLDTPLMLVMDGLMAFPGILLALGIVAALGTSQFNVMAALIMVYTPRIARVVRSSVLVLRELDYIQAATALGVGQGRIMWRHLLPNALAPWLVQTTLILAFALLAEAGLSFLGVGGATDQPSWGGIISEGRLALSAAPWLTVYPGLLIAITVLAVNVVGDAVRDTLDPRLRGQ